MDEKKPLVSVLMTVYNREKYIAEAIESVLASTYKNFELIIVDDCSTDKSVEIAKKYEANHERIKVYINENNLGDYPNRNQAASYAKGKYIKYLDSDDLIYPHGLEVMVNIMEKFPEAAYGLSFGKVHDKKPYPILLSPKEAYEEHFFSTGLFNEGPTSLIFKTDIFSTEGGFKSFSVFGDYGDADILLRLSTKYHMVKMPPSLTWWRTHEGQEINLGRKHNILFNGVYKLNLSYLNSRDCPLTTIEIQKAITRLKQHHARKILRELVKHRNFRTAVKYFKDSDLSFTELLKGLKRYL